MRVWEPQLHCHLHVDLRMSSVMRVCVSGACVLPCPLQGHGSQSAHSAPRPPEGDSWAFWEHDVLMLSSRLPQICSNVLDHPTPSRHPVLSSRHSAAAVCG